MIITGLMLVRNEDWILSHSLEIALRWVDRLVILEHCCTDGSASIIAEFVERYPDRIRVLTDNTDLWDEMKARQATLKAARAWGATHLAIIDADEMLTDNLIPVIRGHFERLQPEQMLTPPLYNLRGSFWRYHADGIWSNRWVSLGWKDTGREHWTGDTFHHREPHGVRWTHVKPIEQGAGGILHAWGASERRLRAKHALYQIVERIKWPHKSTAEIRHLYGLAFDGFDRWRYSPVPDCWTHLKDEICWSDPWQEAEVQRLVSIHGAMHFRGLNLHGLA
jgi:hypothetical protein